jgi:hypothetical protein
MKETRRLTVMELADRWEMLQYCHGITELLITDQSNKNGKSSYVVTNLSMELENEYAFCSDYFGILQDAYSVLLLFLQEDLEQIYLMPHNDWYREKLIFRNGKVIYIEKVS